MDLAHRAFERQVAAAPSSIAVIFGDQSVTYRELDRRANGLAHRLAGVQFDEPIGLCIDRSIEMVVGFLGILKAGGAMLPLDPTYPAERLRFMIDDSKVRTIVAAGNFGAPGGQAIVDLTDIAVAAAAPAIDPSPDNLACVIYTSGSTGRPKGVMVPHRGLVNVGRVHIRACRITPSSRILQFASFSFDAYVAEVLGALLCGASLVVAPRAQLTPGAELIDTLRKHKITMVTLPPSVLAVLQPNDLPDLQTVVSAGEALSAELHAGWSTSRHVVNAYGPTEVTICATIAEEVIRDGRISIGVAIDNARTYVLDDDLEPVAQGHNGELYVSSIGLARGYLGRPALTAERFVPDPFSTIPGARLYRTGDVVRTLPSGALEFVGRADNQLKVRGYRIELGEIEYAIREHTGVRDVAVAVRQDSNEQRSLLAFVVLGADLTATTLRATLAERLPDYLIPTLVAVARFPLTPNNKVDREALLRDYALSAGASASGSGPRSAAEHLVAKAWGEILGFEVEDVEADFFSLGGDSLKAAMVMNTLQDLLEEAVYVVTLYDHPTIAQLAAHLLTSYPDAMARITEGATATTHLADPAPKMTPADVANLRELIARVSTKSRRSSATSTNPRAVFLLSPPRSGSTLVRVMLAGNARLFVPQELGLLGFDRLGDHAIVANTREWVPEGLVRALMDLKGWTGERAKAFLAEHERNHTTTHEIYRLLQDWIAPRLLVDKSTIYALDLSVLRRAEIEFEAPHFIHLMRHPCAMIRSFENIGMAQFFAGMEQLARPPQLAELIWQLCTENIMMFLREIPASRQCELRYEDVVRDPTGQMRALCDCLGIPYDPGMVEPYRDREHKMLDGIYKDSVSRQVGDPDFLKHTTIDPTLADAWKGSIALDALGDMTRALASALGYT